MRLTLDLPGGAEALRQAAHPPRSDGHRRGRTERALAACSGSSIGHATRYTDAVREPSSPGIAFGAGPRDEAAARRSTPVSSLECLDLYHSVGRSELWPGGWRWCARWTRAALRRRGARGLRAGAGRPVLLAMVGAGMTDGHVAADRAALFEFIRFLGRPVWTPTPEDADRFLAHLRRSAGRRVDGAGQGVDAGAVLRVPDRPLPGRHPRADRLRAWCSRSTSSTGRPRRTTASPRVPPAEDEVDDAVRGVAGRRCPRRASTCRRRGTTWRRRCGAGPGCGSTRP